LISHLVRDMGQLGLIHREQRFREIQIRGKLIIGVSKSIFFSPKSHLFLMKDA
jgi:hypothetical protein